MGQLLKKLDGLLELFYEHPNKKFTVRELAKLAKIPKSTAHKYLLELKELDLVTDENRAASTILFRIKKTNYFIENIVQSGLISYLEEKLAPTCIILFGSFRKGESELASDVDLFVESTKKNEIDLKLFEKKLGHKIQIFIEPDINRLPEHLFNNVINGIKLSGFFKLK